MQQIWKDVIGYEGIYQVSNFGRVKSLENNKTKKEKILKNIITIKKLKSRDYRQTYIDLHKNEKVKRFLVSRLVYSTFIGKIPQDMQVDHINNDPSDNRLENLQLLTPSENNKKRFIDNQNLTKRIICLNNGLIYESISEASRKLNLFISNIWNVLKGRRKHTNGYSFRFVDDLQNDRYIQQDLFN